MGFQVVGQGWSSAGELYALYPEGPEFSQSPAPPCTGLEDAMKVLGACKAESYFQSDLLINGPTRHKTYLFIYFIDFHPA